MMPRKLGIIAGSGPLPLTLAHHCRDNGQPVFVVLLKGQADAADYGGLDFAEFRVGAAGGMIKRLQGEGVEDLVFIGSVRKPPLSAVRPDAWAAKFLLKTAVFWKGDDTFLKTLVSALEEEGFKVRGVDELMPELLAPIGCVTEKSPTTDDLRDIEVGTAAALALGARDEGQAAVAAGGQTLTVEDRAGTAAMLANLAANRPEGESGGVLVKTVKPGQERRADLPAIGPDTVAQARAAGLSGIAISAGSALLLEREKTIHAANEAGLFIIGIETP